MSLHLDRPVSTEVVDGRTLVHKRYLRTSAAEVHDAMRALWASPFGATRRPPGMPEPLGCVGDTITMSFADGPAVGARGDLGDSLRLAAPCARLLADFHASGVVVDRRRHAARLVASVTRKTASFVDAHPHAAGQWHAALTALGETRVVETAHVVCHGDFSPRNVLAGPHGPVLIDFDRLQVAHPARDVEYWRGWVWATVLLGGDEPSWALTDAFAAAYLAAAPPSLAAAARDARAVAFHRAAGLLRIAEGWSALRERPEVASRLVREAGVVLSRG